MTTTCVQSTTSASSSKWMDRTPVPDRQSVLSRRTPVPSSAATLPRESASPTSPTTELPVARSGLTRSAGTSAPTSARTAFASTSLLPSALNSARSRAKTPFATRQRASATRVWCQARRAMTRTCARSMTRATMLVCARAPPSHATLLTPFPATSTCATRCWASANLVPSLPALHARWTRTTCASRRARATVASASLPPSAKRSQEPSRCASTSSACPRRESV
mmetsp:Transcript_3475/g.11375  ORF Transcript_3475/g.11375 Transcript_3475/m.11375 type:complete len:223 (-) Transcript_3475:401-1069(-)